MKFFKGNNLNNNLQPQQQMQINNNSHHLVGQQNYQPQKAPGQQMNFNPSQQQQSNNIGKN